MTTTAEACGFGARAPYAAPRARGHDKQEKARLCGLFPRVRNEPLSKRLQGLLKEFEQNAALTGILERRRRMEERMQYQLHGREVMEALHRNLAPPLRADLAVAATSAQVAAAIAGLPPAANAGLPPPPPDAANVMTGGGGPGVSGAGGSTGSGAPRTPRPRARSRSVPSSTIPPATASATASAS